MTKYLISGAILYLTYNIFLYYASHEDNVEVFLSSCSSIETKSCASIKGNIHNDFFRREKLYIIDTGKKKYYINSDSVSCVKYNTHTLILNSDNIRCSL